MQFLQRNIYLEFLRLFKLFTGSFYVIDSSKDENKNELHF